MWALQKLLWPTAIGLFCAPIALWELEHFATSECESRTRLIDIVAPSEKSNSERKKIISTQLNEKMIKAS